LLFFALFKRATKRAIALLLFHSFKKSDKKSDCSFALSKRAMKRAITLLFFQKEQKSKMSKK